MPIGSYRISGLLEVEGSNGTVFDNAFSVGARPPSTAVSAGPVEVDNTISEGTLLTYTVDIINDAVIPLSHIQITTTLPDELNAVSGSISDEGSDCTTGVCWDINNIQPEGVKFLTFHVLVPEGYTGLEGERYLRSEVAATCDEAPETTGQSFTALVIKAEKTLYTCCHALVTAGWLV